MSKKSIKKLKKIELREAENELKQIQQKIARLKWKNKLDPNLDKLEQIFLQKVYEIRLA